MGVRSTCLRQNGHSFTRFLLSSIQMSFNFLGQVPRPELRTSPEEEHCLSVLSIVIKGSEVVTSRLYLSFLPDPLRWFFDQTRVNP